MSKLFHNMALNQESCISALEAMDKDPFPIEKDGILWCNATWDSVLCWPAIPANTTYSMPCPPLKGLDTEKHISKHCHLTGRWMGRSETDFSNPSGWTDYISCMLLDHEAVENVTKHCHLSGRWMGKSADDFVRPQGWTNFSTCMTPVVKEILEQLGADAMQRAQEIARGARKLEFIGLALSFMTLTVAISILSFYRRLRSFRNQMHVQLMLAMLLTVVIRLVLYIDLIFTEELGTLQASDVGYTINTTKIVCEAFYFLLEYGKTVAFAWMFIQGFYLHNTVVVTVFQEAPKLWKYMIVGWGLPLIHVTIWLLVTVSRREIERCLGSYYLHIEFWILDAVRLAELVANTAFLLNIIRVLWYKVKETQAANEFAQVKKSVKATMMLIPLLGIPNIMQVIPFTPTKSNIIPFAIFTYVASFFYMFQGMMVATVYCFVNKEVGHVIKSHYERYRLQHSTADMLRRGSRAATLPGFYAHGSNMATTAVDPRAENLDRSTRSTPAVPTAPTVPLLPPSYETVMAEVPDDDNGLQHKMANGDGTVGGDRAADGNRYNNNQFGGLYYNWNGGDHGLNERQPPQQPEIGGGEYNRQQWNGIPSTMPTVRHGQWQAQDKLASPQETSPLVNGSVSDSDEYRKAS